MRASTTSGPTMGEQPRWPRGTPVAPSGRGPGGGRFRSSGTTAGGPIVGVGGPGVPLSARDWVARLSSRLGRRERVWGLMSHEQVASYLDRDDFTVIGTAGGAYGDVQFRQYGDGQIMAYKRSRRGDETEARTEAEVSILAHALGAPVAAAVPDPADPTSVLMEYVPTVETPGGWDDLADLYEQSLQTRPGQLLGLLDLIVGNADRHRANVRFRPDGVVVGIDSGLAFQSIRYRGQPESATPYAVAANAHYAKALLRQDFHDPPRQVVFSREAIREARRRLEAVKGQIRPEIWEGVEATLETLIWLSSETGGESLD